MYDVKSMCVFPMQDIDLSTEPIMFTLEMHQTNKLQSKTLIMHAQTVDCCNLNATNIYASYPYYYNW